MLEDPLCSAYQKEGEIPFISYGSDVPYILMLHHIKGVLHLQLEVE